MIIQLKPYNIILSNYTETPILIQQSMRQAWFDASVPSPSKGHSKIRKINGKRVNTEMVLFKGAQGNL